MFRAERKCSQWLKAFQHQTGHWGLILIATREPLKAFHRGALDGYLRPNVVLGWGEMSGLLGVPVLPSKIGIMDGQGGK